jgi:hypothetical protein
MKPATSPRTCLSSLLLCDDGSNVDVRATTARVVMLGTSSHSAALTPSEARVIAGFLLAAAEVSDALERAQQKDPSE